MPTYLVWMKSSMNGKPTPEIWHEVSDHPKKSTEHGMNVVAAHVISDADVAAYHSEGSGFSRSQGSMLQHFAEKHPAPKEPEDNGMGEQQA